MTAWSDATPTVTTGTRRYGDGVGWSYVATGISEDGANPRVNATTLVDDAFTSLGDEMRSVSFTESIPIELLVAAVCVVAAEVGSVAATSNYERFLPGFIGEDETPELAYAGSTGLRLDKAHAVGVMRASLTDPGTAITTAARVIALDVAQTRFQVPMVASLYRSAGLIYEDASRWRFAGQDYVDSFVAWFNTTILALQSDQTRIGLAPNFFSLLSAIPSPQPPGPAPGPLVTQRYRRPESQAAEDAGMMTICESNPSLNTIWSLDPQTLSQIKGVANDASNPVIGLPGGLPVFAYPDRGGTFRQMDASEVIALYKAMRDFINGINYFDVGRSPSLPGQPVLLVV